MKILFISHEDSKFGAPKSLMELIKTLKRNHGVEPVVLLHSRDDIFKMCEEENIENYVVGHRNIIAKKPVSLKLLIIEKGKKIVSDITNKSALKKVGASINMNEIDIIHTNVSIVDFGLMLSEKYNIPHITHLREPASILDNYTFVRPKYTEYMNRYTTKAVAISNYVKEGWERKGVESSKIITIYNGLDLSGISDSTYKNGKIRIVFCGSISKEKGQVQLIEAINLLPKDMKKELYVEFIGKGEAEYQKMLERKILQYDLHDICFFTGYVDNIGRELKNYDVGVICSLGEAFGRVTVEYMAAGLCVIASDTGASPEIIEDNISGLLYKGQNINQLASKLQSIIENRTIIKTLGVEAKNKAYQKFSTQINAKNIFELYIKILEK